MSVSNFRGCAALDFCIKKINDDVAEKLAASAVQGAAYAEDGHSPSMTFDDLDRRILMLEDRAATAAVVEALVHFRRLAPSGPLDRRRYQVYCEACAGSVRVDPMRIVREPQGFTDMKANVAYVFELLRALKV